MTAPRLKMAVVWYGLAIRKTDGVPLFVEEMTKAVSESGALKDVNGQYELAGSFSALTIPATLQDSLMARLDRLATAKGVAQYAAALVGSFHLICLQPSANSMQRCYSTSWDA
jgi:predicted ATPase